MKNIIKKWWKLRKLKKLNGFEILIAQFAIQQERGLVSITEVLHNLPLKDVKGYLNDVYNGDMNKKRYYESAKKIIGTCNYDTLRKNLLNYKNKAYVEFIKMYK